jgi:uncharacterized protein DUF4249
MKKFWTISFLIGIIAFANSCDNTIDLTADAKDIPIVYGLLSRSDSVHYIKIQKAFLGADGDNALDVAQIADSLFYNNLDVKIERANTGEIYSLNRVDGNQEGQVKEEGIFADQPNYLYKFILPQGEELVEGAEYALSIIRGDEKPVVTASCNIVSDFDLSLPLAGSEINFRYSSYRMTWKKTAGSAFYDVKMVVRFLERANNDPYVSKSIVWDIEDNISAEGGSPTVFNFSFDGEEFYRFLGAELDDDDSFSRIFEGLDFIVDAGGEDLYEYVNIGQANTGITSSQVIPTYTNLSEGFGVFSSRNRMNYDGFALKGESLDSLRNGIHTRDLNFQ